MAKRVVRDELEQLLSDYAREAMEPQEDDRVYLPQHDRNVSDWENGRRYVFAYIAIAKRHLMKSRGAAVAGLEIERDAEYLDYMHCMGEARKWAHSWLVRTPTQRNALNRAGAKADKELFETPWKLGRGTGNAI